MKRFIDRLLLEWKEKGRRKPLILRGARQVGKTFAVKNLGETAFERNWVIIDLEKHSEWHGIFERNLDGRRILSELEVVSQKKIIPGRTLLFLDEIQACPRAIMGLRYFYEEIPELHVIAAGSLIEFSLNEISFPVGRVQSLHLHPLNFAEFLMARSKDRLADLILNPPKRERDRPSEAIHRLLLDELKIYFFVGGMPEAVATFLQNASIQETLSIHGELIETYRQDFGKYRPYTDPDCIDQVLASISKCVGQQIIYTKLAQGFSPPTVKKAFDLLSCARLVTRVEAASPARLPLGSQRSKRLKALLVDVGLMNRLCGLSAAAEWSRQDLLSIYQGAVAEQFVGQEFLAAGLDAQDEGLFYWSRDKKGSSAEVDYLIARDSLVYPVEVKSGPSGKLRSLHLLLAEYTDCPQGYVLSEAPFSVLKDQKITFFPLYYAQALAGKGNQTQPRGS